MKASVSRTHERKINLSVAIMRELDATQTEREFQAVARLGNRAAKIFECDSELFRHASGYDVNADGVFVKWDSEPLPAIETVKPKPVIHYGAYASMCGAEERMQSQGVDFNIVSSGTPAHVTCSACLEYLTKQALI